MDDSSSESPMEEGSMDGSEHEYEYDIEVDDDEREDEFDEGPDDEEEDDDDDDDEEDEDSGFEADVPFEFQETFGGLVNQLRMVNRDDASAINAQIHFDGIVEAPRSHLSVVQMDGLPSHYARVVGEHFDSRVRETAEWLTAMDANSFWNFVNTHATPHGGGANILPIPRRSFLPNDLSSFRDSDPSYRVHPALARPRNPSSNTASEMIAQCLEFPGMEVFMSEARSLDTGLSLDIRSSGMSNIRTPEYALDDAVSNLNSLVSLINSDDSETPAPESTNNSQRAGGTVTRSNSSVAQGSSRLQSRTGRGDDDEILPVAQGPATNGPGNRPFTAQVATISAIQTPFGTIPGSASFLSRPVMLPSQAAALADAPWDLAHNEFGSGGPSSPFNYVRRPMGSRMTRDRDRSSSTRRWTYDPPGSGGDDLPAIFTGEPNSQRNQHHGVDRRSPTNPFAFVAAESYESVNRLESKIISRLASLANYLRKIENGATKEISDAKKRQRGEKKAAAEAKAKSKSKSESRKKAENEDESAVPNSTVGGFAEAAAAAARANPVTASTSDRAGLVEENTVPMQTDPDDAPNAQTDHDVPVRDDISPDVQEETEAVQPDPADSSNAEVDPAEVERTASTRDAGNTNAEDTEENSAAATETVQEHLSVAAQRAAAIGISLDAPATEDPAVIAAACESTGIDPTFLSALPEDMRSDVFNQLFDSMRNSDPERGGSTEQPVTRLNQDFLIALPPDLRAEVLEAEVDYQARNAPEVNQGTAGGSGGESVGNGPGTGPGDQMDNATFLATLTPDLREEILITAGDEFLASLPASVAAEARILRDREAANQMRHHAWGAPDDAPVLFRRSYGFSGRRGRNREGNGERREDPGMRWENIDDYWYRVGPKEENEVKSSLNDDALKSVVRLLKLSKSSYGKQVVHSVLTSACKNSKARKQVLFELLTMITKENDSSSSAAKGDGAAVFASEGTVVRRALELLFELCKADMAVAEALIGLQSPREKTDDDVELVPVNETERLLSLSTLTSLLSSPLFKRSNVHLEQLLNVISLVCRAFPSPRRGKSKRKKFRGGHSVSALANLLSRMDRTMYGEVDDDDDDDDEEDREARRQLIDHLHDGLSHADREITAEEAAAAEQHLMSMEDLQFDIRRHHEVSGLRRRRSGLTVSVPDSDDSSDEQEGEVAEQSGGTSQENGDGPEEPVEGNSNSNHENDNETQNTRADDEEIRESPGARPDTGNTEATGARKNKKNEEKKPEIRIPVEFRVPELSEKDLNALVIVLRRANCKEDVYEQVSNSLGLLGELPSNRAVTITALANSAQDLGVSVKKSYISLKEELEKSSSMSENALRKKQIVSKFAMGTSSSELMLLRLVKTAATLLKFTGKREKPASSNSTESHKNEKASEDKPSVDSKILAELKESKDLVFRNLQDLWVGLYDVLDLVESELDIPSLDKKQKGALRRGGPGYLSRRRNESLARQTRTRNSRKSLSPVLARLSPTIEAFFITHSTLIEGEDETSEPAEMVMSPGPLSPRDGMDSHSSTGKASPEPVDVYPDGGSKSKQLRAFLSRHRVPVNALLRANPSLLETSFKMALKHPQTIDFDNKQAYFRSLIRKRSSEAHASTLRINVRRDYVYNDSYHHLRNRTKEEMKGRLHVQFSGEEGIDAGGVTREWYTILARQIFDANYALFCRSAAKAATYQPDKRSYINPEHLENFKFVGRFVAKAIYDGQLIDAYFTRAFYKHLLGIKPTYRDIEAQDPEFYNSLKWMLENDISGVLDYTMSAEYEEFGQHKIMDLIPNGRNVPVTEGNKAEYVRAVTEVRLTKAIEKQIEAFKEGFHELIPLEDCKIFNELELELVMSGLPDIDMADLKANVEYTGYTSTSPQINWFWRCVSRMDQEDLARLVMFVTGTSKVPLEGFSALQGMNGAQKFQIHRVAGDTNRLPSAHTCFNQLDLPEYPSADILSERLLKAMRECVGFGFA